MTPKGGCQLMSAYMARILVWFFDINSSMRKGDTIGLVYKEVDGEERFRILKLVYKSQHFSDYWGSVKSLGAWGGDVVLATSEASDAETRNYFTQKGFPTIFKLAELMLSESHAETGV